MDKATRQDSHDEVQGSTIGKYKVTMKEPTKASILKHESHEVVQTMIHKNQHKDRHGPNNSPR